MRVAALRKWLAIGFIGLFLASRAWRIGQRGFAFEELVGPDAVAASRRLEDQGAAARFTLLEGLKHPQAAVRARCMSGLERLGEPELVLEIVPMLQDEDVNVRAITARTLIRLRGWPSVDPLLLALRRPAQHPQVRSYLMEALSRAQVKDVIPDLVAAAADRSATRSERSAAVAGLSRLRAAEGEPVLRTILFSGEESPRFRGKAALALGRLQTPSSYATLIEFLERPTADHALAGAALALRQAPPEISRAARPVLERLSGDPRTLPRARVVATQVLLEMKVAVSAQFLSQYLLTHPEKDVRRLAAEAIPLAREEAVWDSLFEAQEQERSAEVRAAIARSISQLP